MVMETAFRSEETFSREEFWSWLERLPASDVNRYELINGRIVMRPPAKLRRALAAAAGRALGREACSRPSHPPRIRDAARSTACACST
jgi:hypothetical protein